MSPLSTILMVEDDKAMRLMLTACLEKDDFLIMQAATGKRALEVLERHEVDLVLLDLFLPDSKGMEFIPAIRALTNTSIIMVSGEEDEDIKIQCLAEGADDYITKPVNCDMLRAKIKAHIRRQKNISSNNKENDPLIANTQKLNLYNWTVDTQKFQLFDQEQNSANLTVQEFKILLALFKNPGIAMKREDLCQVISEKNYIPSNRSIDVKITRIRKKIGDDAVTPKIIETVRGAGYMFKSED